MGLRRLLVKCGIAACRMRKVKCGMECAESYCGTVGNMRNAESQRSDAFSTFHAGCKDEDGGRSVDQNIGIGTFCSTDFSCKFQFRKFRKFCERKFSSIIKNFTKLIKLSKLKFLNLSAFHVDCSYNPTSVQLSAVHTTLACMRLSVAMELSKTMTTTTIGLYYARIRSPVGPCLLWPWSPISATAEVLFMFYTTAAETVKISCTCCSVCSACMQCPLHERIVPNRPRRTG